MPRIKPPRLQEPVIPEMQDHTPPAEPIELELAGDEPTEVEVELAPAPVTPTPEPPAPAPAPAPVAEDAMVRAAADARRADELQRQNAELQRRDREREQELTRERTDREDAQYNTLLGHIAAQQAQLESARRDMRAAKASGDTDAEIDAVERMTDAKSQLSHLENGKVAFESRKEEAKTNPPAAVAKPAPQDFEAKISEFPDEAKTWLRKHPEFMSDNALNKKIGAAHNYLTEVKNVVAFSPAYFDALDDQFGFKIAPSAAEPEPAPPAQPARRSMPVSAPVSRDVPTASGQRQPSSKIILTAEERQIARTAFTAPDMTNEQKELLYARNKQRLAKERANGSYPQSERN